MPLAARVFCVSVLAMELRQQSANTAYRTTDTAAPESSRNFAEVWPMCPPTRSMVFTWGPECNTCGWRFSTVLASCPPSELTPRSLKGNVFGYAPPVWRYTIAGLDWNGGLAEIVPKLVPRLNSNSVRYLE